MDGDVVMGRAFQPGAVGWCWIRLKNTWVRENGVAGRSTIADQGQLLEAPEIERVGVSVVRVDPPDCAAQIGIRAEHIARLTERFYRVDKSRSRETQGTGLGLAIVKHVLLRHGAVLAIESQPEAGSTFIVRFDANSVDDITINA